MALSVHLLSVIIGIQTSKIIVQSLFVQPLRKSAKHGE